MSTPRTEFVAGMRDVAPVLFGLLPFAMIAGAASINVGLSTLQVIGLSIAFAGAAQMALIELLRQDASAVIILVATTIINVRFTLYSASLAPYFRSVRTAAKLPLAYVLSDHAYALSIVEFEGCNSNSRLWYYLGTAFSVWMTWQIGQGAGIALGRRVPSGIGLDFILPLVFVGLLFPTLEDRATVTAAAVGGSLALAGVGLPFNLGLLCGALGGILAGFLVETGVSR